MRLIEFISGDNESVRGALYEPEPPGKYPAVVFSHGLLSRREEFGQYPEKLAARGFIALAIDFRGHGASEGPRGLISEERSVQDIRRALDFLVTQPNVDASHLALVGHSLGAAFSICAGADEARVKTIVAIAPPASIRAELKPGEAVLYAIGERVGNFYRSLTGKSLYFPYRVTIKHIFHDESARRAAQANNFLGRYAPHDNARTLVKLQDTLACAARVRIPVLVIHGEFDRVVSTSRQVFDQLGGPKQFLQVENSGHSVMLDGRGEEIFDDIAVWLEKHV